jgi:type II secretory pathway pseudopilin PulG
MKTSNHRLKSRSQQGYVLLSLLLCVALMTIAAAGIAASIGAQIQRDREDELIHRATQYRRAIRLYTKKTGRFPMKLEDLENTNGIRYLRRRYKDPITGKDFRVLHMTELPAAMGTSANAWSLRPAADGDGSGDNQESSDSSAPAPGSAQTPGTPTAVQPTSGFSTSSNPGALSGSAGSSSTGSSTFGGGVIIGVASTSPKKTIREFNQKKRYNQWFFFYDPTFDRGFEVPGPTPLTRPPAALQSPANTSGPQTQTPAPQTPSTSPQQ